MNLRGTLEPLSGNQVTAFYGVLRSVGPGAGLLAPSVLLREQPNSGLLSMISGYFSAGI